MLLEDRSIANALEAIYDAALDPAQWPAVLTLLTKLFRAGFADKFARTHDRSDYNGIAVGLDDSDYQDQLLGVWSKRNVWGERRPVTLAGEILTTREIMPKRDLIRSEMYADYLHVRGLHEGIRLAVWSGHDGIEDISLLRPWSIGPYTDDERRLADILMPHLRRSTEVSRRLMRADIVSLSSTEALERIGHGVVLLDASGRIVFASRTATSRLRDGDGLSASATGLAAATAASDRRLQDVILQATGARRHPRSGSVRLPRPSGRTDLTLNLVPLDDDWPWASPRRPKVLVLIIDPVQDPGHLRARLREAFALTHAEAALAEQLRAGEDLASIAHRTGRSVNTLRTHLARLMAKAGVSRQAELIRVLLSLPVFSAD